MVGNEGEVVGSVPRLMNPAHWLGDGLSFVKSSAKILPGGEMAIAWLSEAERQVIRAVRQHLDETDPPATVVVLESDAESTTPQKVFRDLMERSIYDTPAQSRSALHLALLQSLVPDEARILAAVSDGSAYPLMHIGEPGVGAPGPLVLRNASTVGRAAGVAVPARTPVYLTRMFDLGLLEIGPEDTAMRDDYEMLLTDSAVNSAITSVSRGLRAARIIRRTVTISELGHDMWQEVAK